MSLRDDAAPQDHDDLVDAVERALIGVAPEGWRRLSLVVRMTAAVEDFELAVLLEDGTSPAVTPPGEIAQLFREIRRQSYEPNNGTWFSARMLADPSGEAQYTENFYLDPQWLPPIPPESYVRDNEVYPRSDEQVPEWLRDPLGRPAVAEHVGPGPKYDSEPRVNAQRRYLDNVILDLVHFAPLDWNSMIVRYQAMGGHRELFVTVFTVGMKRITWQPHPGIIERFEELRQRVADVVEGAWTWTELTLNFDGDYKIDYGWTEPKWAQEPTAADYRAEIDLFQARPSFVEEWIYAKAGLPQEVFRWAEVFDGVSAEGIPYSNREPLSEEESARVLAYLAAGAAAAADRSLRFEDALTPGRNEIHAWVLTDGEWIWPWAVRYYLTEHSIPPQDEFLASIRARDYTVPEVSRHLVYVASELVHRSGGTEVASRPWPGATVITLPGVHP